jgi:hypothetical protein
MSNNGFYCGSPATAVPFFIALISVVAFQWWGRKNYRGVSNRFFAAIPTDHRLASLTGAPDSVQSVSELSARVVVMAVCRMTHHANNDVAARGSGDLVAIFVLLVIFAFSNAIHIQFKNYGDSLLNVT